MKDNLFQNIIKKSRIFRYIYINLLISSLIKPQKSPHLNTININKINYFIYLLNYWFFI